MAITAAAPSTGLRSPGGGPAGIREAVGLGDVRLAGPTAAGATAAASTAAAGTAAAGAGAEPARADPTPADITPAVATASSATRSRLPGTAAAQPDQASGAHDRHAGGDQGDHGRPRGAAPRRRRGRRIGGTGRGGRGEAPR